MKMTAIRFKLYILLVLGMAGKVACAQSFKWQANLEKVRTNGFYNLALSPQILSKTANPDLADIRIFEKDKEIAYLIREIADSVYAKDTSGLKLQHYDAVPAPSVVVKEDKQNKRTIVQIDFKASYQIDKLILSLEGFRYYRRNAWLTNLNPINRNKKNRFDEEQLVNFSISSGKEPVIDLPGKNRYKQLFIIIENEDSAPLFIKNIRAFQKNIGLIAYLEKNKQYVMKMGQPELLLPRYDLSYFEDSIGSALPFIKVYNLKANPDHDKSKATTPVKKSWMWVALGVLILFLGYLSYFMVRDMQSKKQTH